MDILRVSVSEGCLSLTVLDLEFYGMGYIFQCAGVSPTGRFFISVRVVDDALIVR